MSNHYHTLEVFPGSSMDEIRKAYRRLAIKYHPDKTHGDESLAKKFIEVHEAYEILNDAVKRKEYDRTHGFNVWRNERITNPHSILQQALKLHHYVKMIDSNFIDRDALAYHISKILSAYNIELILKSEMELKRKLLMESISISRLLRYKALPPFIEKFNMLANGDENSKQLINEYFAERKRIHQYERAAPILVIIITILLCLMIYFVA